MSRLEADAAPLKVSQEIQKIGEKDAETKNKPPPRRAQLRGILKSSTAIAAAAPNPRSPPNLTDRSDIDLLLGGVRGEMARMGLDLGGQPLVGKGGEKYRVAKAEVAGEGGHLRHDTTLDRGSREKTAALGGKLGFQKQKTGKKGSEYKTASKSVFKTNGITERPMNNVDISGSLPVNGEGERIEGFNLDFDVVASSEWKKEELAAGGHGGFIAVENKYEDVEGGDGGHGGDGGDIGSCSLAESILREDMRDGPRVDVPGDMGWWDFGDGAQDSEDLNWCEDEEKLVGGNSAREDERERCLFLEVYTLIQNLVTRDTGEYAQCLKKGMVSDRQGREYGDVELQRREGLRGRVKHVIGGTKFGGPKLTRRWTELTSTFDYSIGATKTGEEGYKVFVMIMGKVVLDVEEELLEPTIANERREGLERVAKLFMSGGG